MVVKVVDLVELLEEVEGGLAVVDVDARPEGVLWLRLEAEGVGVNGWVGGGRSALVKHGVDEVVGVVSGRGGSGSLRKS